MKKVLCSICITAAGWIILASGGLAQKPPIGPPGGDVFNVNTPGQSAETPLRAFTNLYNVTAEITADPSSGYDPEPGKPDWPYATDIQKQWRVSVAANSNRLTPEERKQYIPCAAHLNAALDSMERGYRIQISQPGNAAAQQSAQKLYAMGRAEFAICAGANNFANTELKRQTPASGNSTGNSGSPGRPPLKGGVSKSGPGNHPAPPSQQTGNTTLPNTNQPGTGQPNNSQPNPGQPGNNQGPPPVQYVKGMVQGLGDCLEYGANAVASVVYMAQGDFVTAAKLLGLQPGQSLILRTIYQEATTNNIGISPYEAGRIAGRRICSYALIPTAAKVPGGIRALRTPGGTAFNPLEGSAILENSTGLEGNWIKTPKGPMKLGAFIDNGKMGSVYKLADQRGKVIKISNQSQESPVSFPRQFAGYQDLTQNTQILTPKIDEPMVSENGDPSFLVMDNINTKWPGTQMFKDAKQIAENPQRAAAVQQIYDELAMKGRVWVDGHQGNIAFVNTGGKVRAIIVDSDMIFKGSEYTSQDFFMKNRTRGMLSGAGYGDLPLWTPVSIDAVAAMKALYNYWYTE